MPNPILAFTLGLSESQFVSGLNRAGSSLGSFLGTAARVSGVGALVAGAFQGIKQSANLVEGVFNAISRGASLQQLSARTGETVQDLFLLQNAFKTVGLDSEEVGGMLFHLQKAMTGINDVGENTGVVFSILGLNMAQIRNLNAPQQLEAIAKAMQGMNSAQMAGLAGKLFGREGAANFLQLARSSTQFSQALRDNAAAAQQMARNAEAFRQIQLTLTSIKIKAENLFAGIAEGLAPGIQSILTMLNGIDFRAFGDRVGQAMGFVVQTIKDHKFGELLSLSLKAGVEDFVNYFSAALDGITAVLKNYGTHWHEMLKEYFRGFLSFAGNPVAPFVGAARAAGAGSIGSGDAFDRAFHASMLHAGHTAADAFARFYATETARIPALATPAAHPAASNIFGGPAKNFDATSLEKMGFIFGGGGPTILADHARRTAQATEQTARHTAVIAQYVQTVPGNNGILAAMLGLARITSRVY